MEIFTITPNITIACEYRKTRTAFKHEAALIIDGSEKERVKICYQNRTWEQYTYQSVIHKLLEKSHILTKEQANGIKAYMDGTDGYNGAGVKRDIRGLGLMGTIASFGSIIHADNKKAANDWKVRMLKAGLQNCGLVMPEDWDNLSEDEKERRLNGAINQITPKK